MLRRRPRRARVEIGKVSVNSLFLLCEKRDGVGAEIRQVTIFGCAVI
jgi:hypothetical protein